MQKNASTLLYRTGFHALRLAGAPFCPLWRRTPLRVVYERLGRKGYPEPDTYKWVKNCWGDELHLSYSYHLDRAILLDGTYDFAMHKVIEHRIQRGMVCIDIGANLGEVSLHMGRKVGAAGAVYSFEPVPHVYRRLIEHVRRNRLEHIIKPFAVAVSNTESAVSLAFTDENADNQALGSIVNTRRNELTREVTVRACTLDGFVERHGLATIDFIKMDIQGGEWLALQGGRAVFTKLGPDLLIEISPLDLNEIGKDSRQLAELLEDFGYAIYMLRRDGTPGPRMHARDVHPAFSAQNVLCTKRTL